MTADAALLEAVVRVIAGEQARPERNCTYLGTEPAGIRAELDGLEPPWAETVRVARDDGGSVVGAVVVEWDLELGRAWILGPWVAGGPTEWTAHAGPLLDVALAQLPPGVDRHELSGDIANQRLAELAEALGFESSEPNHALLADAGTVAGWGPPDGDGFRAAVAADVAGIAPLHDTEFPGTYATAAGLVEGAAAGARIVLVAPDGSGGVAGYAAGQVHDDGEGFIDFVVVHPSSRGTGLGRRLVQALTRDLLDRSTNGRVCLTVQDRRAPARALYDQLGFVPDGTFVAYRNPVT